MSDPFLYDPSFDPDYEPAQPQNLARQQREETMAYEHMSQPQPEQSQPAESLIGTKDGAGAADHDEPYTWGNHLSMMSHYPFSEVQFGKLIVLRGRVQDGILTGDTEAG